MSWDPLSTLPLHLIAHQALGVEGGFRQLLTFASNAKTTSDWLHIGNTQQTQSLGGHYLLRSGSVTGLSFVRTITSVGGTGTLACQVRVDNTPVLTITQSGLSSTDLTPVRESVTQGLGVDRFTADSDLAVWLNISGFSAVTVSRIVVDVEVAFDI